MARILITGAAGSIGTAITPLLREQGHALRLLDLVQPPAAIGVDDVLLGSATDDRLMHDAARGVDLLLHLASFPNERTWREILDTNVESARVVLDAARDIGVPVTVLASSVHAAGFVPSDEAGDRIAPARPDTYYGWAKVAGEALGSLYADRFGMRIVSARIMSFLPRPTTARALSTWLSPADFTRLVLAAQNAPVGHSIVWGVSNNTRRTVSLEAGRELGFEPQDDAEDFADDVAAELGLAGGAAVPPVGSEPLGGTFADRAKPLGERW